MISTTIPVLAALSIVLNQGAPPSLLVSTQQLTDMLDDPSLVLLHVTDRPAAFEEAHIPGARLVRYGEIAVDGPDGLGAELPPVDRLERVFEAAGVSDVSRVVIYGTSPLAAARTFFTLDVLGHARVALLDGGLRAWRAENRRLETGPERPHPSGAFTPKLRAGSTVDASFIQSQTRGSPSGIALVDVRPDPEFLGTDGGAAGHHAAGHIPGARQLVWDTLVAADGRFLPREQLESKLRAIGATEGKPVVAYCMVGMRASVVYFVTRHLGFDARLYDGSIVDWSQRKLPVETGRK